MNVEKVYIGGWFQRTTLHLTEVADFLSNKRDDTPLSVSLWEKHQTSLELESAKRVNWLLEYVEARVRNGIGFRYYEDGLVILEKEPEEDLKKTFADIEGYYDSVFSPAVSFVFSRGAPVPKELAQIKTLLPFIVHAKSANEKDVEEFFKSLDLEVYSKIETPHVNVYKADKVILIVSNLSLVRVRQLIESEIFFREFKTQLHRYLNIHRQIWEEIAEIKEKGKIPGKEIKVLRGKLSDYQKTVELIDSRIEQMGAYIETRAKVSKSEEVDKYLDSLFEMKFETLEDTLEYIQALWTMTADYLDSALDMFKDIQAESTKTSISSLQLITTLGVVAGILAYLGRNDFPTIVLYWEGALFFVLLLGLTWLMNFLVSRYFMNRAYIIKKEKKQKFV